MRHFIIIIILLYYHVNSTRQLLYVLANNFSLFFFFTCEARSRMLQPRSGVINSGQRGTAKNMAVATIGSAHHAHRAKGSGVREKSTR